MDGDQVILTTKDEKELKGTIKDGVMEIVMEADGMTGHIFLAKPDADTSSYKVLTLEEAIAVKLAETTNE